MESIPKEVNNAASLNPFRKKIDNVHLINALSKSAIKIFKALFTKTKDLVLMCLKCMIVNTVKPLNSGHYCFSEKVSAIERCLL